MVALMVLATFVLFVLVDYYYQRRQPQPFEMKRAETQAQTEDLSFPMNLVGGFKVPAHLSYHPGHAWAMKESPKMVRIGLDDFAARLIGQIDQINLPARGRWLRQGELGWTLGRGSHRFEMLSPIEGEVVDVNPEILRDPSLIQRDPYGIGWLVAVNSPHWKTWHWNSVIVCVYITRLLVGRVFLCPASHGTRLTRVRHAPQSAPPGRRGRCPRNRVDGVDLAGSRRTGPRVSPVHNDTSWRCKCRPVLRARGGSTQG